MTSAAEAPRQAAPAVRAWLIAVALLVVAMILLGGATRLTDSGLSITEWQLVTGTIPPLTQQAWEEAFALYRQIPEYRLINEGMSLAQFKTIYWWEWSHRFLGRLIGLVFLLPLIWFWWRGALPAGLGRRLALIFVLGGLQGALGWYMVMSGLVDRVDVSQYRLTAHLGLAFLILAALLWTILDLAPERQRQTDGAGQAMAFILFGLIFLQILAGALVAGLDAGTTFNSWPLMDGAFLPSGLLLQDPAWINIFENVKTVQFDHRMLAYAVWLLAFWHMVTLFRRESPQAGQGALLFALVTAQAALGIAALLHVVPFSLAFAHLLGAVVLFSAALHHAYALRAAGSPSA